MADTRRIVSIDPLSGVVTILKDLQTGVNFNAGRGTFTVKQGDRRQSLAQGTGRYAGALVTGEAHDNDKVSWRALIAGGIKSLANGSFEGGLTGWTASGTATSVTFAANTAPGVTGMPSNGNTVLDMVGTAGSANQTRQAIYGENQYGMPVTPGRSYTFTADAYVRTALANSTLIATLLWYDAAGSAASTAGNNGSSVSGAATGLVQPTVTASAPGNAAYCKLALTHSAGATTGSLSAFWDNIVFADNTEHADDVLAAAESMLLITESTARNRFLEWRPEDASASSYYEIAGPAAFELTYEWVLWKGTKSMFVDVEFPVRPLVSGALQAQSISSFTAPNVVSLTSIPGTAKAKADIILRTAGGETAPIWGLVGWSKTPTTPLASSVAPWGVIEAETAGSLTGFALYAGPGTYRGSTNNGISVTASGAGSAAALYYLDPSTMEPDDFTDSTIDIEVWARVSVAGAITTPRITLSLEPFAGTNFGSPAYTAEYGSAGKVLAGGTDGALRLVRLGVLTMPVDKARPQKWTARVAASWAGGSGAFRADYLVLVPARQRFLGRTGITGDSSAPKFVPSSSDTRRLVRSDLSGALSLDGVAYAPAAPMGGAQIELPSGSVQLCVVMSSTVPDDPASATGSNVVAHTAVTGTVLVTPRYFLTRTAS